MIEIFDGFDELDEREVVRCARRLRREVDEGKAEACWRLAALYEDGLGVKRDFRRAFELREQGALANEPNAIVWLAYSYEYAVGTRYNLDKALELYRRAIDDFPEFRSRGFACCQFSIHKVLRRVKTLLTLRKDVAGVPNYQTIVDVGEEDRRVEEIYEQCNPSSDPLYCLDLSTLLRVMGEPKELCEEAASRLDEEAFVLLEEAAKRGNSVATCFYADVYGQGDEEYVELIRRVADEGCAWACVKTGYLLECENRLKEALSYYERAAELDYPDGLCKAGSIWEELGDMEAAARYYRRGAEFNHEPSLYMLGSYYWRLGDDDSKAYAVDCWRRSADAGFALAMERYADYLKSELGDDSPKESWAEVARYYRGAMDLGLDSSKVMYACLLNVGRGVDRDEREAERLIREIEESGDSESKEILAYVKCDGEYCRRDLEGANRLLAEAAKDRPSAQLALGWQYFSGENAPADEYHAARLVGSAAKAGVPEALAVFSRFCYEGRGVLRNDPAGEFFLRAAADAGDPASASRLGYMYSEGEFGAPNWRLAAQWFQIASARRDAIATGRLAYCYWNGLGVSRDRVYGAFLWGLAEEYGDDEALESFERARLSFAVERLLCKSEDRLETLRNCEIADSMKEWMETRTREFGGYPSRTEFFREYKSRVDAFYNEGLKIVSRSGAERAGAVDELLEMFGKCAADAARVESAKGTAFKR